MIEVRKVSTQEDVRQIEKMARAIFHEFYYPQMPKEHIDFFIGQYQTVTAVNKQLASSFEYFIYSIDNKDIGYLGLEHEANKLILSKLYVYKDFRSSKIGVSAIEKTKERAKENKLSSIELFVNAENERAISFYKKHGFKEVSKVIHTYANQHSETDLLMRLKLKK